METELWDKTAEEIFTDLKYFIEHMRKFQGPHSKIGFRMRREVFEHLPLKVLEVLNVHGMEKGDIHGEIETGKIPGMCGS